MKRLFLMLIVLLATNALYAQVKVIDQPTKNISTLHPNTVYEMKADELNDGRIKITFRTDTSGIIDLGQLYLNSYQEFDDLYDIIKMGFTENKNQTIFVDLGDNILALHYNKGLLSKSPGLRLSHSYKNALYNSKMSKLLDKKDIDNLFAKK